MAESPSILALDQLGVEETTVQDINDGSRKKKKRKNRREVTQENRYRDTDPLGLTIEVPCHHNSLKLQCRRITSSCLLNNRRRFYRHKTKVQQDVFLTRLVAPYEPERRRQSNVPEEKRKRRKFSTTLYLTDEKKKPTPVCQALFLKVFSIRKDRLRTIATNIFEGKTPKEKRGGDRKSHKSLEKRNKLKEFINKFPATESHYSRNKTKRVYLSCDLNQAKIRRLYNNSVTAHLQVKKSMFQKVFAYEFNIGFKSPASDTCSTCILLTNQIKNETDIGKKRILMVQKRVHSLRAKAFYKLSKIHDTESVSFCFDLQQVQPLPRTPIQEAFYARQVSFYNLCFVGMDSRHPVFYQWTEIQSGRGSIEVGSALLNYLDSLDLEGKKVLRLFCDGCGGQNKNSHIIHALVFWLLNKSPQNVKEIHMTFPVRGHSFLPADRVFGRVEKHIRTKPIIVLKEEYEEIYKEHGTVRRLGLEWDLIDVKGLDRFYKKIEGMRDLKKIKLRKGYREEGRGRRIQRITECHVSCFRNYVNESEEERKEFSILKRLKTHPKNISFKPIGRILPSKKKQDVRGLLIKQFGEDWINNPNLHWYKNLLDENDEDYQEVEEVEDDEEQCDCLETEVSPLV